MSDFDFRTTISISVGGRRRHLAISHSTKRGGWILQWATPTAHGHHFDPPLPGVHKTKKLAVEAKRACEQFSAFRSSEQR